MIIDCDTCTAGPRACGDCIVTHLLPLPTQRRRPEPAATAELDPDALVAVEVLAAGGLVPPLRLVAPDAPPVVGGTRAPQSPGRTRSGGLGGDARAG